MIVLLVNMIQRPEDEVKKKIEGWLLEDGFNLQPPSSKASERVRFLMEFKETHGLEYFVLQFAEKKDQIMVGLTLDIGQSHIESLRQMDGTKRNDFLSDLYLDLNRTDCLFVPDPPQLPTCFRIFYPIWYDGLTKDSFMRAYLRVSFVSELIHLRLLRLIGEPVTVQRKSPSGRFM